LAVLAKLAGIAKPKAAAVTRGQMTFDLFRLDYTAFPRGGCYDLETVNRPGFGYQATNRDASAP
jgi:hypothetical protein